MHHQFQRYDPAQPKTVTSFKGNQKLIFEGYRYNIHHIVPAKGVKTWRCVCAKKLTCSRSWCKGRAETWDEDGQGISKGEHNHPAEHEVAELEYFKSQLILAAIASPNANLNDLIDEAVAFMSEGVSFGSRESLKKSLTVARKAAENGGFKLKCYKSSDKPFKSLLFNNLVQPQQKPNQKQEQKQPLPKLLNGGTTANVPNKSMLCDTAKSGPKTTCNNANMENTNTAHVMTLLSLAKQCRENSGKEKNSMYTITKCSPSSCCPSSTSPSLLDSSGFHSSPSLNSSTACPSPASASNSPSTFLFAAVAAAAAAAALNNNKSSNNNSIKKGGVAPMGQKRAPEKMGAKLSGKLHAVAAAAASENCANGRTSAAPGPPTTNNTQLHNAAQIMQRKKARVNSIFDRLSTKVAAAAATNESSSTAQQEQSPQRRNIELNVAETQTDNAGTEATNSAAAVSTNKDDGWRVMRICCCEDRTKCTRGQKRKRAISYAKAGEFDAIGITGEEHSPPPSASSSVENQPQQNGTMGEEQQEEGRSIRSAIMLKLDMVKQGEPGGYD